LHRRGNEAEWWNQNNIDPIGTAQRLWTQTRLRGLSVRKGGSEQVEDGATSAASNYRSASFLSAVSANQLLKQEDSHQAIDGAARSGRE
jgi:hypothetical protein